MSFQKRSSFSNHFLAHDFSRCNLDNNGLCLEVRTYKLYFIVLCFSSLLMIHFAGCESENNEKVRKEGAFDDFF
jgi:hypothetical protein